ncbi:putative ARS-binding protein [Elsinoe fawcettii]|nr:putative ARS-binding protein [Elsinoe fawcettii]
MDGLEDIPETVIVPPLTFSIPRSEVGRVLPGREVNQDNITDAYVQFILFCNPAYPNDIDTAGLRDLFNKPPSSNQKSFEVFDIYVLFKRLNEFDGIRTWQQLALELGVEPGIGEDGAGSQRVPQYIVRLKKWMKGAHIDAFFFYLLGKPHEYYQEIPPLSDPHPADGRDGIQAGEDLALRALDPRLRPKRGRKRVESSMDELPPAQRHAFTTLPDSHRATFSTPLSAVPRSAFPNSAMTDRMHDPWSSNSTQFPSALGLSALEPRSAFSAFAADPRIDSMPTPVIANRINKWNLTGGSASSHSAVGTPMTPSPLLQPPAQSPHMNRNMPSPSQARRAQPTPSNRPSTSAATSSAAAAATRAASGLGLALDTTYVPPQANMTDQPTSAVSAASTSSRRERQRLQLQVPKHTGAPIRLMTPPAPSQQVAAQESAQPSIEMVPGAEDEDAVPLPVPKGCIEVAYETLKRSLAADLLRGQVKGQNGPITGLVARQLASTALDRIGLQNRGRLTLEAVMSASIHLGLTHMINFEKVIGVSLAFLPVGAEKKIQVRRFAIDEDGYEEPLQEDGTFDGEDARPVKHVYDISWQINTGGLQGEMYLKGLELGVDMSVEDQENETAMLKDLRDQSAEVMRDVRHATVLNSTEDVHAGAEAQTPGTVDWREKYFELEKLNKGMHNVLEKAKDKMINVVLEL